MFIIPVSTHSNRLRIEFTFGLPWRQIRAVGEMERALGFENILLGLNISIYLNSRLYSKAAMRLSEIDKMTMETVVVGDRTRDFL